MADRKYYIGIDVGTGSTRAAIVRDDGCIVSMATHPIETLNPEPGYYEQSSTNIWDAVIVCVKKILLESGIDKSQVCGVGFDATCSLVVLDKDLKPLGVNKAGKADYNIVLWMDHRAGDQAERINITKHPVLRQAGGKISLEMAPPKLMWLKENLPDQCWLKAEHFFDLPDFLTWRATGSLSRSLCSLACKCLFEANSDGEHGWNDTFLTLIGLGDLIQNNYAKIGNEVLAPGNPIGQGLSPQAAEELGLAPRTPVGTSVIDAHSGVLGSLACSAAVTPDRTIPLTNRMALICGTSTCHMTLSNEARYVDGIWGPYYSAIIPNMWTNEGGQSATGKLLDHIVETHSAYGEVKEIADSRNVSVYTILNDIVKDLAKKRKVKSACGLTENLHVWPDFHGNRAPLADPSLTGMITGLTLSSGTDDLAALYLATVQALAYGTRQILDELAKKGQITEVIHLCGGLGKNPLFVSTNADVTGLPVVLPEERESVLLGAAVLGACASGTYSSVQEAMKAMGGKGQVIRPNNEDKRYHDRKYKVFLKMVADQLAYRDIMSGV